MTYKAYLYTLMLYIEQAPLKAKMVKELKEYLPSLLKKDIPECFENAWIVQNHGSGSEVYRATRLKYFICTI